MSRQTKPLIVCVNITLYDGLRSFLWRHFGTSESIQLDLTPGVPVIDRASWCFKQILTKQGTAKRPLVLVLSRSEALAITLFGVLAHVGSFENPGALVVLESGSRPRVISWEDISRVGLGWHLPN